MASKPRCFRALEPVEIELRCAWRVKLLNDAVVAQELRRLIAFEASRCQVQVACLTIEVNHLHLVLAQEFSGHDAAKRRGISPMMRNLESRATHWLNARYSLQGRLWERSFKSHPRADSAQVLKSITYTLMNPVKHGAVERAEDYEFSDWEVYFAARPDGIVTHVPALWSVLGRTPEERAKRIKEIMEEVWAEGERSGDLLKAAHRVIEHTPALRDGRRWAELVPVGAWVGKDAAEKKRNEVLAFVAPRTEFEARGAPSMGQVIDIRIKQAAPRPLAGASWREWHT